MPARGGRTPNPAVVTVTLTLALLMVALYLFIWLYLRPSHFEVSAAGLTIVWPLRRETFPAATIAGTEVLSGSEFRSRYGRGMRVGAGGLFGGFGLAVTRVETFRMYVSRADRLVIVRMRSGRSLLLTPDALEDFVQALGATLESGDR